VIGGRRGSRPPGTTPGGRTFQASAVLTVLFTGCLGQDAPPSDPAGDHTVGAAAPTRTNSPTDAVGKGGAVSASPAPVSQIRFTDVAAETGINFRYFADAVPGRYFMPEVMGAGVGWVDFDADGRLDLYAANGRPLVVTADDAARAAAAPKLGSRLFRQTGAARFTDVSGRAAADVDAYGQGIAVGDYDADGFDDLFLTAYGGETLLRNNGDGTFADVTAAAGATDPHWSTGCVWLDVDGDRLLDLYVANYMDVTPETHKVCVQEGRPKYCGPGNYAGVPDVAYLNRGDGTFAAVPPNLGFSTPAARNGLGVLAADFDDDLAPELYIANDMEPNFLFHRAANGGTARYQEVAAESGCAVSGDGQNEASMGVACGDLDGDGRPDLYLTHYYHTKNTLYRNLGGLLFADRSGPAGVAAATHERLGFGASAADFDRDGDLDLFAANGHVLGPENPPSEMEPGLLVNDGSGRFVDAAAAVGGYFARKSLGRGAAAADFDDDGDVDLAVSHLDHPLALLKNVTEPAGPFLALDLVPADRLPPVGGRVRVTAGGRTWVLPVVAGGSYLSSDDRRLFVGLGAACGPATVEVFWPSGEVSRHEGLEPNACWRIHESGRPPERRPMSARRGQGHES
jgi:hypothetical protein